jgi:NADPH2 dehydrogenase
MAQIRNAFVLAAQRADHMGIEAIELHGAHGYLLHDFNHA